MRLFFVAVCLLAAVTVHAQNAPTAFEVASIKPNNSNTTIVERRSNPGRQADAD
jgi:hypothetical protein